VIHVRPDKYPPGFEGHPWLYLMSVFGLMLIVLLTLEWLWRIGWSFTERPHPLKHPSTVARVVMLMLLVGILMRVGPDAWLLMRWPSISDAAHHDIEIVGSRLDVASVLFMSGSWLVARLADPFIQFQLEKQPLPIHLWPTARQLRRPLYIGLGVFAISFALTFLR
jgi:hypothetical protein